MSILDNAKDSIIMGLEDYSSSDSKRLTSCTRNLNAGILLLFKYKLSSLSAPGTNEALIKAKVSPFMDKSGNVIWKGKGKNTVTAQEIEERFVSLGISVQWDRVKAIQKFRNNLEHYYSKKPVVTGRVLISNTFLIIRNFLTNHLSIVPRDFLGERHWNTFTSVHEVYTKEKELCIQEIDSVKWESRSLFSALVSFKCSQCGSGLISIRQKSPNPLETTLYCKTCDKSWDYEDIAEEAIEEFFEFDNYVSQTDGGEPATIECPQCTNMTYILEEQYCVICEGSFEHECSRCGTDIPWSEIDGSGYCSWCSKQLDR